MPGFDANYPSPARVYDYLAGGRDNFATDRKLAQKLLDLAPHVRVMVRENRAFLTTAVRWVAAQGVAQVIDLGSGLPTAPAIHEAVKAANPDARVAYVDNDPVVVNHLVAVASKDPVVTILDGDLRDAEGILAVSPSGPGTPACLVAGWVLHFFPPEAAAELIRRYVAALASGSYLVVSIGMLAGETGDRIMRLYSQGSTPIYRYTEDQVAALFDGLDLVGPGLVDARVWAPGVTTPGTPAARPGGSVLAAVARKP
jgi:O-methyltransferase involved in polyketide biosynthesis